MTGAGRRIKGRSFEQLIATAYRKRWPSRVVRRSSQSHKAHEPDVVVEGVPLWTECQHASTATPMVKLQQAELDTSHVTEPIYPVAVWRKTGARTIWATMRFETLCGVWGENFPLHKTRNAVVTVDFNDWLERVEL